MRLNALCPSLWHCSRALRAECSAVESWEAEEVASVVEEMMRVRRLRARMEANLGMRMYYVQAIDTRSLCPNVGIRELSSLVRGATGLFDGHEVWCGWPVSHFSSSRPTLLLPSRSHPHYVQEVFVMLLKVDAQFVASSELRSKNLLASLD